MLPFHTAAANAVNAPVAHPVQSTVSYDCYILISTDFNFISNRSAIDRWLHECKLCRLIKLVTIPQTNPSLKIKGIGFFRTAMFFSSLKVEIVNGQKA